MAHRAATDEICVAGGYGERPIKQKAGTRQSLRLVSFGSKRPCLPNTKKLQISYAKVVFSTPEVESFMFSWYNKK